MIYISIDNLQQISKNTHQKHHCGCQTLRKQTKTNKGNSCLVHTNQTSLPEGKVTTPITSGITLPSCVQKEKENRTKRKSSTEMKNRIISPCTITFQLLKEKKSEMRRGECKLPWFFCLKTLPTLSQFTAYLYCNMNDPQIKKERENAWGKILIFLQL